MHPVEEYQNYNLERGRIEWVWFVTLTRRRWAMNYYITLCTGNSISWRQNAVGEASTQQSGPPGPRLSSSSWEKMLDWGTCPREAGPPGAQVSSSGERERNADGHMSGGQYVAVLFGLQLPHTQHFQIKWEVYFSKEKCRSSLLCRCYDSAYRCICIMWLYNKKWML